MITIELAKEINDELARAKAKFPKNKNLTVALMEEVGELAQAELQSQSHDSIKGEAIQVIALCLRIIEEGDASIPRTEVVQEARA